MSDLSGITVYSTQNALTCQLISNGKNSCATEGYIPIVFSVNCLEAVACDIGVRELAQQEVELFPEPSDGLLTWRTPAAMSGAMNSWICDGTGRTVRSGPLPRSAGNSGTLDVRNLDPGQYVLHVEMEDSTFSRRFTIAR